jgi:membrane-bound inhibitor of C-type lysozyme
MVYNKTMFKKINVWIILVALIIIGGGFYAWNIYKQSNQQSNTNSAITITAPGSGDIWTIGSAHTIVWTTKNIPLENKISITIRRIPPPPLATEGQEFDPIIFTNLPNTGSADWTIADAYPSGTYILAVNSYKSVPITDVISAESAPFQITQEQIIGGQKDAHGCLAAAGYSWCQAENRCLRTWEEYCTVATPKKAIFTCDDSKTITATFYPTDDKYVDLILSDGRNMSIPHAISASGARYAKADESFVFWNKGNTAFVTENGTTTFSNCVTSTQ